MEKYKINLINIYNEEVTTKEVDGLEGFLIYMKDVIESALRLENPEFWCESEPCDFIFGKYDFQIWFQRVSGTFAYTYKSNLDGMTQLINEIMKLNSFTELYKMELIQL